MKKFTILSLFCFFVISGMAQPFLGVSWYSWQNEPDYDGVTGYAENPYDKPVYVATKVADDWSYSGVTDAATFDASWDILGDSMAVANVTNVEGGDIFDLGESTPTFGSAWKAAHDGENLYLFLKYWDVSGQADADSRTWEIMSQPTSIYRHEPSFQAVQDSAEDVKVAYENQAYARFIELGGGKAAFNNGAVSEFAGSVGLGTPGLKGGQNYYVSSWGANDHGLTSLALATHFWNVDAEGTIRAIMVMPFDGALAYPEDPTDLEGNYVSAAVGDTISFDVKSNATTTSGETTSSVAYFWSSDKNNGYGSIYYSGLLVLEGEGVAASEQPMLGVSWYSWQNEPDYDGVTGYAENPYTTPKVTAKMAPASWSYSNITDAATFDDSWGLLGDSMVVANPTTTDGGDLFDLGESTPTFGSAWKAVHDGANLYVFLKYWDVNSQADADSRTWEIMSQPTSIHRYEPTFEAAQDSAEDVRIAYENQAYARFIELGGGKAAFSAGAVSEFAGSVGLGTPGLKGGQSYFVSSWGANDYGLTSLALASHFWNVDAEGTIRAIMVMPFDGALAHPEDITDLEGNYISLAVGDTISFDVKSNATTTSGETTSSVAYFWSSDKNNGYGSIYYSGHLAISDEVVSVGTGIDHPMLTNVNVYYYNDLLRIEGLNNANVDIYSISGALVKTVPNVNNTINVSDLPKGIYFVKLNNIPQAFKVMKY